MTRRYLVIALGAAGMISLLTAATRPPSALRADAILVEKSQRRLTLLWRGSPVKTYHVSLGRSPVGKKECAGDHRTPEGRYRVDSKNEHSAFHRALHLSYPNTEDLVAARRRKCNPGGEIMIHGLKNGLGWLGALHRARDWTAGCIAVTDPEIEEIWNAVPTGAAVEIRP